MKYLMFFILIMFVACAKEITNSETSISDERRDQINDWMMQSQEVDFKHDYIPSNFTRAMLSPQERKMIRYASANSDIMLQKYPEVKSTISDWLNQNKDDDRYYNRAIHFTSLKYLRRLFLLENQSAYVSEVSFLLKILIDTKSVDLDILADAFHYCSLDLSSSDRNRYLNYIRKLHDREVYSIRAKRSKLKEMSENSTGPTGTNYSSSERKLDRRYEACLYTRDLLGVEIAKMLSD